MKKLIILCAIVLTTLLLIISVAGCQQKTQPSPSSSPSVHPSPAPRPVKYIKMEAAFDKDNYPPGDEISIELFFTNVTTRRAGLPIVLMFTSKVNQAGRLENVAGTTSTTLGQSPTIYYFLQCKRVICRG